MKKWMFLFVLPLMLAGSVQAEPACGDFDLSGVIDISDIVYLVDFMFSGGPPLPFPGTADCDGAGGDIDISTLICWVECWFVFEGICTPQCSFVEFNDHSENSGQCLDSMGADSGPARDRGMYIVAVGNEIHVYHPEAYYQCCLGYNVQYYRYGNHFIGYEADTNELCDCYCPFDLESTIHNLSPGEYIVTLIDIDGNLEGVDTAVVATGAIYFDVGECVPDPKGPPEWGDPIIYYLWQSGVLTMVHENAWFNCAADLMLDLEIVGDTLRFHERNVNGDFPVPCMCYYELTSIVEGLPPGSYVAEVYNQDYPWEESLLLDRRNIHLPAGDSSMSEFGDSGCLSRGGGRSVVNYEYNGDTLNLQHFDATFNCGAVIEVGFNAVGDTLRFYEINISEEYMACDCSFDVTGRVYNIAPGSYVAEVYARNEPDDPLLLVDRQTIVLE